MSDVLTALYRERAVLHRYCLTLGRRFADAHVHHLPHADALRRVMESRYDQLAALDMAIASYDPQQALFDDAHV